MSIITKQGKNGRTIIIKDGFDAGFGAVMLGSMVGKVSLPANVKIRENAEGERFAEWDFCGVEIRRGTLSEAFASAARGEIKGAICYGVRKIQ